MNPISFNNFDYSLYKDPSYWDSHSLKDLPKELCDQEEIVLAAIKNHGGDELQFASDRLKDKENVVLVAVAEYSLALAFASDRLRDEEHIILAAMEGNRNVLEFASKRLQGKKDFILQILGLEYTDYDTFDEWEEHDSYFQFISKELCDQEDVALALIQQDGYALRFVSERLQNQENVVLAAFKQDEYSLQFAGKDAIFSIVKQDPTALEYAPFWLQNNESFMLSLVQECGMCLGFGTPKWRDNTTIVLAAVKQNGLALQFASERLQEDPPIVQTALRQNQAAVQFAADTLIYSILEQNGMLLRFLSETQRAQPMFVFPAVRENAFALQFATDRIVLFVVARHGMYLRYTSSRQRDDYDIVLTAVRQHPEAVFYASPRLRGHPEIMEAIGLPSTPVLSVHWSDLTDHPLEVLSTVHQKILSSSLFAFPKIEYINSISIDGGALSREFVSRLFSSIFDFEHPLLPVKPKLGKERFTPLIAQTHNLPLAKQIIFYKAIGLLCAVALGGHYNITTGSYFEPVVFEMIHALTEEDFASLPDDLEKESDIPPELFNKLLFVYAKSALNMSEEIIEKLQSRQFDESMQDLGLTSMDDFLHISNYNQILFATLLMAQLLYIYKSATTSWNEWKTPSAEILCQTIEGQLSREQILAALRWGENPHEGTKAFLLRWLREDASEAELESFVQAISGAKTLTCYNRLKTVFILGDLDLPTFRSCFYEIHIPTGYTTYEIFKQKLTQSLTLISTYDPFGSM